MRPTALLFASVLALTGCSEQTAPDSDMPHFEGVWYDGDHFGIEVVEDNDGNVTGSGSLGSFMFSVTGTHDHPAVTFTTWRDGDAWHSFEGEFTDDDTVEGTLEGTIYGDGGIVLKRMPE